MEDVLDRTTWKRLIKNHSCYPKWWGNAVEKEKKTKCVVIRERAIVGLRSITLPNPVLTMYISVNTGFTVRRRLLRQQLRRLAKNSSFISSSSSRYGTYRRTGACARTYTHTYTYTHTHKHTHEIEQLSVYQKWSTCWKGLG